MHNKQPTLENHQTEAHDIWCDATEVC